MSQQTKVWPGLENLGVCFRGPGPEAGPVPTVWGFALSARMTLDGGPLSLPAERLARSGVRVLSLDLPEHRDGMDPQIALRSWAHLLAQGLHPFREWLDVLQSSIGVLQQQGQLEQMSFYGISRGALLASWAAAHLTLPPSVHLEKICAWAPLVRLSSGLDFEDVAHLPAVQEYDSCRWAESLSTVALKVWIGNLDRRVGVRPAFDWVKSVAEAQQRAGYALCRSELIIRPSIGHLGHGTPPEAFQEGVTWLQHT
jgi:hypothetical protein